MDDTSTCPTCGAAGIPIAYGYPSDEMLDAARRGEIRLGGCVISDDDPYWECSACGRRWRGGPAAE